MDGKSSQIKISVIVPTYNRAQMLSNTLRSIKCQSLQEEAYEIIVVDNGSKNNTQEIVRQVNQEEGKRVHYICEPNLGLHNARHAGARKSIGEILAYTDDDVVCDKNWLTALLNEYHSDEIVCVGGKILPKWEVPPPKWMRFFDPWTLCLLDYGDTVIECKWPQNPFGCNFSIRKDILFELGGFNPECMGENWIGDGEAGLLRRIYAKKYKVIYTPEAIVWHIVYSDRITPYGMRRRLSNFGAAHSCADYKLYKYSPFKLLLRSNLFLMKYIKHSLLGLCDRYMKRDIFHFREALKSYNKSRALYELRLIFDRELIKLVAREDWING